MKLSILSFPTNYIVSGLYKKRYKQKKLMYSLHTPVSQQKLYAPHQIILSNTISDWLNHKIVFNSKSFVNENAPSYHRQILEIFRHFCAYAKAGFL